MRERRPHPPADIETLGLGTRARNMLRRHGVHTVDALCAMTPSDVRDVQQVGPATLAEIRAALELHGLDLNEETHLQ